MINVMVTSAGAGPGISVIKALKIQKELKLFIVGADQDLTAAGLYLADTFCIIPNSKSPKYLNSLIKKIKYFKIKYIFPIFDTENLILSANSRLIKKKTGATVLCNNYDTIINSYDKLKAQKICELNNIITPKKFDNVNLDKNNINFPIIIKPVQGMGSQNMTIINNLKDLKKNLPIKNNYYVQKKISGIEYSIDILSYPNKNLFLAMPRQRIVVKAGQMVKGKIVFKKKLINYAKKVAKIFKISSSACLQCIVNKNKIYFIELNSRFGTGLSLTIASGLNLPLIQIKIFEKFTVNKNIYRNIKKNLYVTRYWSEIFI
jgi:carbamoyl-phosphate synthase large subunit